MHKKIEELNISKNRKSLLFKNAGSTQGGQAMIISVVSFVIIFILTTYGLISPTIRDYNISSHRNGSKQSLFLSESGLEDAFYRIKNSIVIGDSESIALAGGTVDTDIAINTAIERTLTATSDVSSSERVTKIKLLKHDRVVFPYSVQVDDGGVDLQNSSQIIGDIFSNGPVGGLSLNSVTGNIVSSGAVGLISNIAGTLSAKAHTIQDSSIGTQAYYTDIANTTVDGSPCVNNPDCYPNVSDLPNKELPITDAMINEWKAAGTAGGVIGPGAPCVAGVYTMTATALGSKKILCDVVLTGNTNAVISGHLWIVGKFTMNGTSTIAVGGNGTESFAMVVDNPLNRITSSSVSLDHVGTTAAFGGNAGTFVLISSAHDYIASGTSAITMLNATNGSLIAYAKSGQIEIQQTVNVAAVSGYKVITKNSSILGMVISPINPDFSTIPINQWRSSSWKEI